MELFEKLQSIDLILASQSPRRKALMEMAGFSFRTWVIPGNEEYPEDLLPEEVAIYLCRQKALPFKELIKPDALVITADTIVVKDNMILNKAADAQRARRMLEMLSGSSHRVITGVCLTTKQNQLAFTETTRVHFAPMNQQEIEHYITTCQPFDKAGAYGIQEWIGAVMVEKIEGSYHNVVGLPMARLYQELKSFMHQWQNA